MADCIVDLRVSKRGRSKKGKLYEGYCWWNRDGSYKNTIYLHQILKDVMRYYKNSHDAWIAFNCRFWTVWLHEIIGHGIGHKFRTKGYSSKKDGHFEPWIEKGLLIALIQNWRDRRIEDLEIFSPIGPFAIFSDVEDWIAIKSSSGTSGASPSRTNSPTIPPKV